MHLEFFDGTLKKMCRIQMDFSTDTHVLTLIVVKIIKFDHEEQLLLDIAEMANWCFSSQMKPRFESWHSQFSFSELDIVKDDVHLICNIVPSLA